MSSFTIFFTHSCSVNPCVFFDDFFHLKSIRYLGLVQMEQLWQGNGDWRVVGVHLHDVGHHVPPTLGDRVYVLRVL